MNVKVKLNEKQKIIISLTDQLSDLSKYKIRLKYLGKFKEAQEVQSKYEILSEKIDDLIAKEMSDWLIDKQAVIDDLNQANFEIDDAIDHIKKDLKTAEKVVKLLKQADKVIEIATEILKKIP